MSPDAPAGPLVRDLWSAKLRSHLVSFEAAAEEYVSFRQREQGFGYVDRNAELLRFYAELSRSIETGEFDSKERRILVLGDLSPRHSREEATAFFGRRVTHIRGQIADAATGQLHMTFPPYAMSLEDVIEQYLSKAWTRPKAAIAWCERKNLPVPVRWLGVLDSSRLKGRGRPSIDPAYEEEFRRRAARGDTLGSNKLEAKWLVANVVTNGAKASPKTIEGHIGDWKNGAGRK